MKPSQMGFRNDHCIKEPIPRVSHLSSFKTQKTNMSNTFSLPKKSQLKSNIAIHGSKKYILKNLFQNIEKIIKIYQEQLYIIKHTEELNTNLKSCHI